MKISQKNEADPTVTLSRLKNAKEIKIIHHHHHISFHNDLEIIQNNKNSHISDTNNMITMNNDSNNESDNYSENNFQSVHDRPPTGPLRNVINKEIK